jgi:hypothetical protein
VTGGDWIGLALTLGLVAGLVAWRLDAGGWIAHRIHIHREAARFTMPDHYNEQDWT